MRPLDFVAVKWRRAELPIYELLAEMGAATPEQRELAHATQQVFDAYHGRRWQDALAAYTALVGRYPGDTFFPMLVVRCRNC